MTPTKLEALRAFFPDAQELTDSGNLVYHLPRLEIPTSRGAEVVQAILYPHAKDGYQTRLYLDRVIPATREMRPTVVCGSTWYASSWQGVSANLSLVDILRSHMGAFAV